MKQEQTSAVNKPHPIKVVRIKQVVELIGLAKSTIYDKMDPKSPRYDSTFPRPFKIGLSAVGWSEQDIYSWIESKMVQSI